MMPSELTVVIPVHNGENYLSETISSVLAQSYPAREVLVIDDGSTDRTAAVASAFGDRVRLIRQEKIGVSAARNLGISAASSEWVALMDHDDLWELEHLGNLAATIAANPEVDICYTGFRRLTWDPGSGHFVKGKPVAMPSATTMRKVLLDRCAFIPSAAALRKEKVVAVGGFDGHFLNGQDWELWLRLRHAGARFAYSPEPTLLYRVHPDSSTNKVMRARKFYREVVKTQVSPYLSPVTRIPHVQRVISRLDAEAAILLRENGAPGAFIMMLQSILRYPFSYPHRYSVATHMLMCDLSLQLREILGGEAAEHSLAKLVQRPQALAATGRQMGQQLPPDASPAQTEWTTVPIRNARVHPVTEEQHARRKPA